MNMTKGSLRELHQLHLQLQEQIDRLKKGPRQIVARKKVTERKQIELEADNGKLKQLKMASDEKTLQLKINESKIAELKLKLNMSNSNREFDIFKSQIDADTMANSVLEDEILEVYEKIDRTQEAMAACEKDLATVTEQEQATVEEVAAAEPGLRQEADRLEGALAIAERDLPGSIVVQYRRLVQAHGADALASVEEKSCRSCYTILTTNEIVELNLGKMVFCRDCGKLLYHVEGD